MDSKIKVAARMLSAATVATVAAFALIVATLNVLPIGDKIDDIEPKTAFAIEMSDHVVAEADVGQQVNMAEEVEEVAQDVPPEATETSVVDDWQDYDYGYYYEYGGGYGGYGDGFMQQGVREFNGRTETWYSSNVLYHQNTSQWSVDDEGYYRTDDGYYVVAASEYETNPETGEPYQEGDIIQTSKGEGIVLDSGCDEGVTDFYVGF